jgi:hypothetical protein
MTDRKLAALALAMTLVFAAFAGGTTAALLVDTERISVTVAASGNTNSADRIHVQQSGTPAGGVRVGLAGNAPVVQGEGSAIGVSGNTAAGGQGDPPDEPPGRHQPGPLSPEAPTQPAGRERGT